VELANDVGADVGGRHQDAEEVAARIMRKVGEVGVLPDDTLPFPNVEFHPLDVGLRQRSRMC
jgi:hypothetical protein